ncbi:MAG: hypothetical protein H0U71_07505 [Gammaproteobacteria bacterium]|nr:hypothetical protein [Gammaproteobacteria bacterium]
MNVIYVQEDNLLTVTLEPGPDESVVIIDAVFDILEEKIDQNVILKNKLIRKEGNILRLKMEFDSTSLCVNELLEIFNLLKNQGEDFGLEEILVNGQEVDEAMLTYFNCFFERLVNIQLVTPQELQTVQNFNKKPTFRITDALPSHGQTYHEEAKRISAVIIFHNQLLFNWMKPEKYLSIVWRIEWLFLCYMRCVFNSENLLTVDDAMVIIRLITNLLRYNENRKVSLEEQVESINNSNCANIIYEYYNSLITSGDLALFHKYLSADEFSDARQLAFAGLYNQGLDHLLRWLDNEYINIEYKIGGNEYTLLLYAVFLNKLEIVNVLIKRGANLFSRTADGNSVLNLLSVNTQIYRKNSNYLQTVEQITEIIFNINLTANEYVLLCSENFAQLNRFATEYTCQDLKRYVIDAEGFIRELVANNGKYSTICAYFELYKSVNVVSGRNLLLELARIPSIDPTVFLKLLETFSQNIFNYEIIVEEYYTSNNNNNNNSNNLTRLDKFNWLIKRSPILALTVMKNYRFSKHNRILNSPFKNFLEIKVIDEMQQDEIDRNYAYTYLLMDAAIGEITTFFNLIKLPIQIIRRNQSSIVVIKLSFNKVVKYINMVSGSTPLINTGDVALPSVVSLRSFHDYDNAAKLISNPVLGFLPSLAARRVQSAIDSDQTLVEHSRENIRTLIKKYNLEKRNIHEEMAKSFSVTLNKPVTTDDIDQAFNNIIYHFAASDYDLLHATKDYEAILKTQRIYSHHYLNSLFLTNSGMTSILDEEYGNNRYVFAIFNTPKKSFPEKLGAFYGETVFTFSALELRKLGYTLWVKPSDWYYFSQEKTKVKLFGRTKIVVSHHWDSKMHQNYKVVESFVDNELIRSEKINMLHESFVNEDIPLGLALLLINMLRFLDPQAQFDLISPFLPNYFDHITLPQDKSVDPHQYKVEQQEACAASMHEFFPACEGSIANSLGLTAETVTNIQYLRKPETSLPSIEHYQKINSIYLAIDKGLNNDEIEDLILTHKEYLNIPHAICGTTLLVKAMLDKNYEIMQFLLLNGANPNQVSKMSSTSSQFTPTIIAVLLNNSDAIKVLLDANADFNQVIYLDHNGLASFEKKDEWDVPLSPAYVRTLFNPNFKGFHGHQLQLPLKRLLVFLPIASHNNEQQLLIGRKGYKRGDDLVAHGDWLLPAVLVDEYDLDLCKDSLSYLVNSDLKSINTHNFKLISNFQVRCLDASYSIYIVRVDLTSEYNDIPRSSDHLAELCWCLSGDIDNGQVNGLPIHYSNLLAIRSLRQFPADNYAAEFQKSLNAPYLLHQAIINGDVHQLETLLQRGVSPNVKIGMLHPVTYEWFEGCTPLMTVALYADPKIYAEIIRILIKAGADISIADKKHQLISDYGSPLFVLTLGETFRQNNRKLDTLFTAPPLVKRDAKRPLNDIEEDFQSLNLLKIPRP